MPRFDVRFWTQDISRESVDAPGKRAGIQLGNNLLWQYYLSLPLSVSLSLSLSLSSYEFSPLQSRWLEIRLITIVSVGEWFIHHHLRNLTLNNIAVSQQATYNESVNRV